MKFQELFYRLKGMLNSRSNGIRFLIYNVSGNAFTLSLNLILPFLLTSDSYGYFVLVFSVFNLLVAIFTFGLDSTIIKFSIEAADNKKILLTSFLSWTKLALPAFLLFIPVILILTYFRILDIDNKSLFVILISSAMMALQRITLSYYIGLEATKKYGTLFTFNKIIQFIIIVGASYLFSLQRFLNILPLLFLFQSLIVLSIIFFNEFKIFAAKRPTNSEIKEITRFTLPLTINTFGNLGYSYGFNVFVSPFLSLSQLGVLNIFNQFANISNMTLNALNNGYIPKFYTNFNVNAPKAIDSYFKYISLNTLLILAISLMAGIIYRQISYANDSDYTILALFVFFVGIFFYSYKSIGSNILIIKALTMRTSVITLWSSALNILIGILLTKFFGFMGCIVGLSIGYTVQVFAFNMITISMYKTK